MMDAPKFIVGDTWLDRKDHKYTIISITVPGNYPIAIHTEQGMLSSRMSNGRMWNHTSSESNSDLIKKYIPPKTKTVWVVYAIWKATGDERVFTYLTEFVKDGFEQQFKGYQVVDIQKVVLQNPELQK